MEPPTGSACTAPSPSECTKSSREIRLFAPLEIDVIATERWKRSKNCWLDLSAPSARSRHAPPASLLSFPGSAWSSTSPREQEAEKWCGCCGVGNTTPDLWHHAWKEYGRCGWNSDGYINVFVENVASRCEKSCFAKLLRAHYAEPAFQLNHVMKAHKQADE